MAGSSERRVRSATTTQVVILVVDVLFVLVRLVAAWLIGLIGREPEDFLEPVVGMISAAGDGDDTEIRSGFLVFIKKHIVLILFAMNGVVALLIGFVVNYVEHHNVHPVLSHIDPDPTPTSTPSQSSTPSSCAT